MLEPLRVPQTGSHLDHMMCFEATGEEWLRNGSKRLLYFLSVQSKCWLLQNFLLRGERAAWEDGPIWSAVPGIHSPPEGAQVQNLHRHVLEPSNSQIPQIWEPRISRTDKVKNKWRTGGLLAISVTSPSLRRTHHHRENNLISHENDWRENKKNGMEVSAATCWMRELINLSFRDWRFLFWFLTSFRSWMKIKVLKEPLTTLKTLNTQRTLWRLKTLITALSHFLFFSLMDWRLWEAATWFWGQIECPVMWVFLSASWSEDGAFTI